MTSIPLTRAVLCVEDDRVFEIGSACPACDGTQWVSLARLLDIASRRGAAMGELASGNPRPVVAPPERPRALSAPRRAIQPGDRPTLNSAEVNRLTDVLLARLNELLDPEVTTRADVLMAAHNLHESVIEDLVRSYDRDGDPALGPLETFRVCLEERIERGGH